MASKKKEKNASAEKNGKSSYGLPVALAVLLLVGALSLIALGLLKRSNLPADIPAKVDARVTHAVIIPPDVAESIGQVPLSMQPAPDGQTEEMPPAAPVAPAPEAAATPSPATPLAETDSAPAASEATPFPPAATAETGSAPATPETAPSPAAPDAAVTPAPDATVAEAAPPESASPPAAEAAPGETVPAAEAAPGESGTPDNQGFPPPPGNTENLTGTPQVPKPLWQTVGKNWDKVQVENGETSGSTADGGDWKQLNVGQADTSEPAAQVPEPEKKAEPAVPSAAGEKPEPVKPAPQVQTAAREPKVPARRPARGKRTARNSSRSALIIINESGIAGQAEVYRDVLSQMGYRIRSTSNQAPRTGPTRIVYGPGQKPQALALAGRLPGDRVLSQRSTGGSGDIVIYIRQ